MASRPKLKDMIETSEEYLRRQHDRWDNSVRLYKGEIVRFRKAVVPRWAHAIEVNLTKPTIDTMLPNLIYKTPKIMFRPGREIVAPEVQQMALGIENDINAIQLEIGLEREYKRATKDALLLGNGFVKYGLTDTFGYDEETFPFPAPFVKRVSPWELGVDPSAREHDLSDAEWIWFRSLVPLYRAQADNQLTNKSRLKAISVLDYLPKHLSESADQKKAFRSHEFCVLYELWSRERNKVFVLDEDGNVFREIDIPYELYGHYPIAHISFNQVPDEFYCMSEAEHLENLQLEISEKRTQWINHTRRFNRKYRVPPDMTDDDIDALTKGGDGTVVRSREDIQPIEDAPMSGDVVREIDMVYYEAKEVTGISAYQRGGAEQGVYTATEASMIGNASTIRIEERRLEVSHAIARGAKILYNILRESKGWPQLPFDFTVDITTMRRPDDEQKRQDLIQLGQVAAPFPEFKRAGWLADVALTFQKPPEQYVEMEPPPPPPDPKMQLQMQEMQLKMQEMQLQIQIDQQKAQIEIQKMQADAEMQVQILQEKLAFEREKMEIERQHMMHKHQADMHALQVQKLKNEENLVAQKEKNDAALQLQMSKVQEGKRRVSSPKGKPAKS